MSLIWQFKVTILPAYKSFNIENKGIWTQYSKQNAFDYLKAPSKYWREVKMKEKFSNIVKHFAEVKAH